MEVRTERRNATLVAEIEGRIDGIAARELEDAMKSAISDEDAVVIVDLEGVSYISSAGLRAILLVAKDLWKRDAKFSLCSLAKPIHEVFDVAGFHKIIKIHDTRAEALTEAGG